MAVFTKTFNHGS